MSTPSDPGPTTPTPGADAVVGAHLREALATTADAGATRRAAERAATILRPQGAFGRLDEVAIWLAGWQRRDKPRVEQVRVIIFGGDHGVATLGVSAYPATITKAMVEAIGAGMATSSALAAAVGAELSFVDVGVGEPTADFTVEDAMSVARFVASWEAGRAAVAEAGADVLILGELGIGNTTAAAAVAAGVLGGSPMEWVGRGSGVDDAGLARKQAVVGAGLDRLARGPASGRTPLEVLRRVGGTELVAMAGAAVEARRRSIPLILDGFIGTAAVAPLHAAAPGLLDHAIAGHRSAEAGHHRLLGALDKAPLVDLDLRLGEATGALVALPLLRAAAAALSDVATFAEAGIATGD